jgi:hypothetical protein
MRLQSTLLLTFVLAVVVPQRFIPADEQAKPLPAAHAHNDYMHKRPLLDAIEHGFCSVEADIFLIEGQLLVAHDRKDVRSDRTLESLYLEPLRKRVAENGGRVYRNGPIFWLLIDIKSDGPTTFMVLKQTLAKYADILSSYGDEVGERAVSVVISGNRPRDLIASDSKRLAAMDGRISDLNSADSAEVMPWISDNWLLHFRWYGVGEFPAEERQKLHAIVAKAHAQKRLVRFWATPEVTALWRELIEAKVDLINTDDLEGLRDFLTKQVK